MRIGLTVQEQPTLEATLREFERTEALGAHTLWYPHAFGFDALSVLALAATRTRRAHLGSAVVPMYPRHPVLTAQAAQVAASAAEGRLLLGVGAGHRAHVTAQLGLEFRRPVGYAREYVLILRALLRGDPIDHVGAELRMRTQLVSDRPSPPVVLAAVGPQMLRVAGEVADAAITWLCDAEHLRRVAIPALAEGAELTGREMPQLFAGLPIIVHDNVDEGRAAAAMWLAEHSQLEAYRNALDRVSIGRGPGDVALVGDEATIIDQIRELFDLGVTEVGLVPLPAGPDILGSLARTEGIVATLAEVD